MPGHACRRRSGARPTATTAGSASVAHLRRAARRVIIASNRGRDVKSCGAFGDGGPMRNAAIMSLDDCWPRIARARRPCSVLQLNRRRPAPRRCRGSVCAAAVGPLGVGRAPGRWRDSNRSFWMASAIQMHADQTIASAVSAERDQDRAEPQRAAPQRARGCPASARHRASRSAARGIAAAAVLADAMRRLTRRRRRGSRRRAPS